MWQGPRAASSSIFPCDPRQIRLLFTIATLGRLPLDEIVKADPQVFWRAVTLRAVPGGRQSSGTCAPRRAMVEAAIMSTLRIIGRFLLRSGSLQASPTAPGVRGA
jgi:hypothetical protein